MIIHDSKKNQQLKKTGVAAFSVWDDFKAFINRGNVVDLAVGVVMGGAFTGIVTSFVSDIITPLIGRVDRLFSSTNIFFHHHHHD
jgi:large conductance mechanosensitive channel protein